jgi:serine/threonine protein kinase
VIGNFSKVILGVNIKTGEKVAIKVIEKKEVDNVRLATEVEIMKKVNHPNIISLKDVYDSGKLFLPLFLTLFNTVCTDPSKLYLVMELVTGGELFNKIVEIGSYSEKVAKSLVKQIVSAVKYLHEMGIAHRDIKPTYVFACRVTFSSHNLLATFFLPIRTAT